MRTRSRVTLSSHIRASQLFRRMCGTTAGTSWSPHCRLIVESVVLESEHNKLGGVSLVERVVSRLEVALAWSAAQVRWRVESPKEVMPP